MGWNGSGVVTRDNGTNSGANTWENDRDASIKITAENHDTHDQDLADAIQNTIAKDGQNYPTADLPMNNQKHTGVGTATAATHYARADQVQNGAFIWGGTAAGTADAITFNLTPTLNAYTTGLTVRFLANGTTTVTNPTININAAGAKTVKDQDGNALSVGDIASGTVYEAVYDGTDFRIYVASSQDLSDYVTGPASATDNAVALFDGTGGKTLKDGVPIGVAAGNILKVDQSNTNTASATTTTLGTTIQHTITGTTTITAFGGVAGVRYQVVFAGVLTLTHNASSLILPGGANITTAAGDQAEVYMITASTCRVKYTKASGQPVAATSTVTRVTEVSASGSAVDFTSIPSNANSITLSFSDVSLDSAGNILVQIGDAGGIETSGYDSGSLRGGTTTVDTSTAGFILSLAGASNVAGGNMRLQRMGDYRWSADHGARVSGLGVALGGGIKNLSDTLTTVRVTTTTGSFDGGLIGLSHTTE